MSFTTLTFILFLFIVFTIYWRLNSRRIQNIFLVVVSYIFYGWWDYRFCILLFGSSLIDYCIGLALDKTEKTLLRRYLLIISLVFNLSLLGFFKYWNFFIDSFSSSLAILGWSLDTITVDVILPVGISFYTFQTLSYTVDIYRRQLRPATNLINYLCYVSFFPQLVAGPIERATYFLPQVLSNRSFKYSLATDGCRQILWGFFKKMAIADNLAPIVERAYSNPNAMSGPQLVFATFAFALQVYCDFSAYSDIAIGTAKLFGFDLMRNFAYPYFSQTMAEFWRRWHISLSTWLRDYVYIPLGGSRVTSIRSYFNVMITFFISGLWHGASWNFIVWGGIHGSLILVEKLWTGKQTLRVTDTPGGEQLFPRPKVLLRILTTFTFTCFAWIFFRAKNISDALLIVKKIIKDIFDLSAYKSIKSILEASELDQKILLGLLVTFIVIEWLQRRYPHALILEKKPVYIRWAIYTILIWITLFWGTWNTGQFVYFQF